MENQKNIEPELKSIKEYLSLPSSSLPFTIPTYQRAYSWGIDQCDKMLSDIEDFINYDGKDPYFFGTIILDCSGDHLNLIDGQQRTTTFYLLLKALLLRIEEEIPKTAKDKDSKRLTSALKGKAKAICKILYFTTDEDEPDLFENSDNNDFKEIDSFVQGRKSPLINSSINEDIHFKPEFLNILHATTYAEAESKAYRIPRKQRDNRYSNFFRNFKWFYDRFNKSPYSSASAINNFTESLLNKCQVIQIKSWNVEQAIVMFNSLNSTGLPLSDADVLSAQLYSQAHLDPSFGEGWERMKAASGDLGDYKLFGLQNLFTELMYYLRAKNKDKSVTLMSVRKYFMEYQKNIQPLEFLSYLNSLISNWRTVKAIPLTNLVLKLNFNANFFISSFYLAHGTGIIEDHDFLNSLLKLFIILEIDNTGYSSRKFKQFLFDENISLVDPSTPVHKIAGDFRKHIAANWKPDEICDYLKGYRGNLLVYVNEYLFSREMKQPFYMEDDVNIEHIMPNSGKKKGAIRYDADISQGDGFSDYVNMLGNKILLEGNLNKAIGDTSFAAKRINGYKKSKYALPLALSTLSQEQWTIDDIKKQTEKTDERILKFIFD